MVALVADIIKSKEIHERKKFQTKLKCLLEEISISSKYIISPYTITLGDEFQALYSNLDGIIKDSFKIITELHPVQIRFSFGLGEITTEINKDSALGMDGPAFHNAREGIESLKKTDYNIIRMFESQNSNSLTNLINMSLNAVMAVMESWKNNTFMIFTGLLNNCTLQKIADSLEISVRGVYKIIETNKLREIVMLMKQIEYELAGINTE